MIGCGCPVCTSPDPRNQRFRCSIVLGLPHGNLLIDTTPDLRSQLLRERIGIVHAVLYTHEHADHIFGLDDLRLMQFFLNGPVPLHCEPMVEQRIRKSFSYAFGPPVNIHAGGIPRLEIRSISTEPFTVLGREVIPIRLHHGPNFEVLGFRIGNIAYCTDTNGIPPESMERLTGLDVLILGALRHRRHETHFCVDEAVEVAQKLQPRRTLLTHISHHLEHVKTNAELPQGIELAYDGLRIPLA